MKLDDQARSSRNAVGAVTAPNESIADAALGAELQAREAPFPQRARSSHGKAPKSLATSLAAMRVGFEAVVGETLLPAASVRRAPGRVAVAGRRRPALGFEGVSRGERFRRPRNGSIVRRLF